MLRPLARRADGLFAEDFDRPAGMTPERKAAGEAARLDTTGESARLGTTGDAARAYTADDLDAARAAARSDGYAEALATIPAAPAPDPIASLTADRLATEISALRADWQAGADAAAEALGRMVCASLATAFPQLCRRHGPAEVAAVTRELLAAMPHTPHLRLHVAPACLDRMTALLAEMHHAGGGVDIIPDTAMGPADLRLTWRHGMAERDGAGLWARMAEILVAHGLHGTAANGANPDGANPEGANPDGVNAAADETGTPAGTPQQTGTARESGYVI